MCIIVGPCRITGSYAEGIPSLDSDIDISVDDLETVVKYRNQIDKISRLFNVKIDLSNREGGINVNM